MVEQDHVRTYTLEALEFLMLKCAFSHILETIQHQKLIKIEYYILLQTIWDIFMLLHTLQKISIFQSSWKSYALII